MILEITNEKRFNSFLNDGIVKLNDLLFKDDKTQYGIFPAFLWGENVLLHLSIFFKLIFEKFGKNKWYVFESSNEAFKIGRAHV